VSYRAWFFYNNSQGIHWPTGVSPPVRSAATPPTTNWTCGRPPPRKTFPITLPTTQCPRGEPTSRPTTARSASLFRVSAKRGILKQRRWSAPDRRGESLCDRSRLNESMRLGKSCGTLDVCRMFWEVHWYTDAGCRTTYKLQSPKQTKFNSPFRWPSCACIRITVSWGPKPSKAYVAPRMPKYPKGVPWRPSQTLLILRKIYVKFTLICKQGKLPPLQHHENHAAGS
jgi:hypothetical protein